MKKFSLLFALLLSMPAFSDSFRCGMDLVRTGDLKNVVIAKCGNPVLTNQISYVKERSKNGYTQTESVVEDLIYRDNVGTSYSILRFEKGALTTVTFKRCQNNEPPCS